MKAKLDEWNDELGELEAKFEAASDATKTKLAPHLAKIRDARDATIAKLGEIKESGEARGTASKVRRSTSGRPSSSRSTTSSHSFDSTRR